jgi:hypothetical protein
MPAAVTPERFAQGLIFDEYVADVGSPANLRREGRLGPRTDASALFQAAFERSRLTDDQRAALRWLGAQAKAPARMLVISEDWSSDCRREVPTCARIAAETGWELRIFNRDGQQFSRPTSRR